MGQVWIGNLHPAVTVEQVTDCLLNYGYADLVVRVHHRDNCQESFAFVECKNIVQATQMRMTLQAFPAGKVRESLL